VARTQHEPKDNATETNIKQKKSKYRGTVRG
jgi:hypothetical protein